MTVTVLSYSPFFFYDPFVSGVTITALFQLLTIPGWLLVILAGPLSTLKVFLDSRRLTLLAISSATIWPASLLALRAQSLVATGDAGFEYLQSYPIFILTDLLFPLLIIALLVVIRVEEKIRSATQVRRIEAIIS